MRKARGGCGRPRFGTIAAASAALLAGVVFAQPADGASPTLDLLHFMRISSVPGIFGGVAGMTVRLRLAGLAPTRGSWAGAAICGFTVGLGLAGVATARGWHYGNVLGSVVLGSLISEPLIVWLLTRTSRVLDRGLDRALPPGDGGGASP